MTDFMTNTLYTKERFIAMTQTHKALLLAAAMIGLALLAVFGVIPEAFTPWAPFALLAIFPGAWLGRRTCTVSAKDGAA